MPLGIHTLGFITISATSNSFKGTEQNTEKFINVRKVGLGRFLQGLDFHFLIRGLMGLYGKKGFFLHHINGRGFGGEDK